MVNVTGLPDQQIVINSRVRIPTSELRFVFSRSQGPGGQKVNKVSTRVTLLFDLSATKSLTSAQSARIRRQLYTRIDRHGVLRIISSKHRTQLANRRAAIERFVGLLAEALIVRKPRIKTSVTRGAKKRRLQDKTRRSKLKQHRQKPTWDDN